MKFDFLKRKEILKWNKKRFTKFHKCSLLDSQNKLAKMQRTQPLINGLYDKWESKEVSVWKKRFLINSKNSIKNKSRFVSYDVRSTKVGIFFL